jgi:hypothetical protein
MHLPQPTDVDCSCMERNLSPDLIGRDSYLTGGCARNHSSSAMALSN